VLGGTLIIGFLAFPMKSYKDLFKTLYTLFRQGEPDYRGLAKQIERLSRLNRLYGKLALEKEARNIKNPFLRKGIELIVDKYDHYDIIKIMEKEYELYFAHKESMVNILNTLQKLSPAIGFVGTIIGLIDVLGHIGSPEEMGRGMAVALHTTLYGLLFANFLFLPLYKKLSENLKAQASLLNVILEGVLDVSKERNSKAVGHRLQSYIENYYGIQEDKLKSSSSSGWSILTDPLQKLIAGKQNV
jgi:chemotaxis protein MotA